MQRQLDGAKAQCQLEMGATNGTIVPDSCLDKYIRAGVANVRCPAGGEYTIGPIGEIPKCSFPGHQLPEWTVPTNIVRVTINGVEIPKDKWGDWRITSFTNAEALRSYLYNTQIEE